ncbi:MAG: ATP-binding protein [Candidatus Aureabacteria bacterium]|nr:ATP-binding protein [Candidatus Auribacterota bacterium]
MKTAVDIAGNRFFSAFSDQARRKLLTRASQETLRGGAVLFEEDDPADQVYLVLSGEVELTKQASRGRPEVIARVGPGDYFGEMGVLDGYGRSTGARTAGPTTLATIPAALLLEILSREPTEVSLEFLRRVSERLRTANARFMEEVVRKEKLQAVGEMASSIIHDFKNPMTSIRLAADVLIDRQPDETTSQFCQIIQRQVTRMVAMAQEVLDYCRGEARLNREKTTVRDLFKEIEVLNEDYLRANNMRISFQPIGVPLEVDRNRIIRALQNLLSNAVEALSPGGGKIEFSAGRPGPSEVEIRVADNGPGVPEEIRDTLFDPFVTAGKRQGTGLGLAIAKAVIEAHGGVISCRTSPGAGTTFIIRLPVSAGVRH